MHSLCFLGVPYKIEPPHLSAALPGSGMGKCCAHEITFTCPSLTCVSLTVCPGDAGEVPNAGAWGCQPGQPPNLARFAVELDQRFLTELAHTTVLFNELFDQSGRKQLIKVRHPWEGLCSRGRSCSSQALSFTGAHGIWTAVRMSDLHKEHLPL